MAGMYGNGVQIGMILIIIQIKDQKLSNPKGPKKP